ncbi:putative protein kinase RLK-Pelle-CrRLK1L-1 family [Helianthus annuus]|nr:putative protein kinase RLK-Pelle-CrRLK1L-1 family [Helianthus annuus]
MLAFSLPFFFVLLFSTTISQAYTPTDHFFLSCGSSAASYSNSYQRYWHGDEHSKFVPSNFITTSFSSAPDHLHSSLDDIPYSTARIFNTSIFTYTFPVSQGPKYLRLHFYPATYSDFKSEQSFLSVSSNGYSLLTNFSAFQVVRNDARVLKEFLIYVTDAEILTVTLKPSHNSHAFINGIEIVHLPEDLYYKPKSLNYVQMISRPVIDEDRALENIYRLNVGGPQISISDDTGMYRSWDQDEVYIYGAAIGLTPVYDKPIMYTVETPNYTAPEPIYKTQRSMGKQSEKYNLTWILPVDSGFYYMLRLHFCNIIPQYTKQGQVIFKIFINHQTAEDEVDLFNLTQGSWYPVVKDYIVLVNDPDGRRSKQDLWLAMHPNLKSDLYLDAYLNGLEVFKLSMDKNLAGPNPELGSTTTPTGLTPTVKENKKKSPYAVIIGGVGGAFVLLSISVFIVFWRRRRAKNNSSDEDRSPNPCRRFSLKDMKAATDEFNDNFVIGNGGFGKVYKGCIDNTTTIVAIKRLDSSSQQDFQEFSTDIEMLSKLRHVQLVSLIGYCDDEGEMILVYDYMEHGTLREHLYHTNKPCLSWKRRLDICVGVAKGLHYLHSGGKRAIIHGDVKSTNILLDENWVAKLSDFGLSKLGSEEQSETHVNTMVKGSFGHIDPEYYRAQQLTKKSDVYSFGVVLFEVLCARPVIDAELGEEQVSLVEWCKTCHQKGTLHEILDPQIRCEIAPRCLRKFGDVASKCLHEEESERPAMEEVVWRLEFALQLQEDAGKMDGPETM